MALFPLRAATAAGAILLLAAAAPAGDPVSFPVKSVTARAAEIIVNTCIDWYRASGNHGEPAIWVINANGDPILMKRLNGATRIAIESGKLKAETSLHMASSTSDLRRFLELPNGYGHIMLDQLGAFPAPGGVPIRVDGAVIGAVGVGGIIPDVANNNYPDDTCAKAGIDAAFGR